MEILSTLERHYAIFGFMKCFFFLFLLFSSTALLGQNFTGHLYGGAIVSHMTGDNMEGYNKPGYFLGFGVSYPFRDKLDLSFSLSYVQKGSRRRYTDDGIPLGGPLSWHLFRGHYIEIPIIAEYRIFEDIKLETGLSTARFVGGYYTDFPGGGNLGTEFVRDWDLSFHLGGNYEFQDGKYLFIRHSNSLISVENTFFTTVFNLRNSGLIHHVLHFGFKRTF